MLLPGTPASGSWLSTAEPFMTRRVPSCAYVGHRGYGCEGFPSESHSGEAEKIGSVGYFRGGMTLKSHSCVGICHAASVVDYLYECASGVAYDDLYGRGSGVDGVFHKLFDN